MSAAFAPEPAFDQHALRSLDDALTALAMWCPHGFDSSRASDYNRADRARELIEQAKAVLGVERELSQRERDFYGLAGGREL